MGGVPNAPGPSPTLGSLGPSHQWRHKSRASLRGPPCAHGVAGTPEGEVRDTLAFNQKLEAYVANTGDVVNKAQLFDANLAQHPVTAKKVIPVLVDFANKMEELLDEMRVLFDGLLSEVPPLAAENLSDISGEIPSLTGWGKDAATETPTKLDRLGPSEPRREEVAPARPEPPHSPRMRLAGDSAPTREVLVESNVGKVIRELEEEEGASLDVLMPTRPARIDVV